MSEHRYLFEAEGWDKAVAYAQATAGFPPEIYEDLAWSPYDARMCACLSPGLVIRYAALSARYGSYHCTGAQKTLAMRLMRRTNRSAARNVVAWRRWCEQKGVCCGCRGEGTFEGGTVCSTCHGTGKPREVAE